MARWLRYGIQPKNLKSRCSRGYSNGRRTAAGSLADASRLVSFYASDELRACIEEEMGRTGMSKTQVIVEALEQQRYRRGPRR